MSESQGSILGVDCSPNISTNTASGTCAGEPRGLPWTSSSTATNKGSVNPDTGFSETDSLECSVPSKSENKEMERPYPYTPQWVFDIGKEDRSPEEVEEMRQLSTGLYNYPLDDELRNEFLPSLSQVYFYSQARCLLGVRP